MDYLEASQEVAKQAKQYCFEHPQIDYATAQKVILEQDPELAAAYNGTISRRQAVISKQFELDRKLKDPDNVNLDIDAYQYRCTAAETLGWREASRIYGIDIEREIIEKITREIMNLENKLIMHQNVIANFPEEEKRQKEKIETLQAQLGTRTGYVPTEAEVKKEQDKLLTLGREFAIAEEELPRIESELTELRKKLEKLEAGKKFSRKECYPTPSHELAGRAEKYALENRGVDYSEAVKAILEEDLVLSEAYNCYSVDDLLGLNDQPVNHQEADNPQEKSYDNLTSLEAGKILSDRAVKRQRETGQPYVECFNAEGQADPELLRVYARGD